jgi:hypothetical protein
MPLLHKPEPKELLEIAQLMKYPNSRCLLDLLESELVTVQNRMLEVDSTDFAKYQGRGKMLKDLLQFLQDQGKRSTPL